jgi:parallel beta-helix repeat protein
VGNEQAILCTSGSHSISGNNLTSNGQGIIFQTENIVLRDNHFNDNNDSLPINSANFVNDVDSSNTLNGKPICYWVNRHGETVPSNAGFVALVNCTDITVQYQVLSHQANGILLAYTTNSTITNNLITNNANGIFFYGSSGNRIVANNITDNGYAVYIGGATVAFFGGPASYTPSSNNLFHSNNFVNNNQTLYDVAGSQWVNSPPSANSWDNGATGNFWGDYAGTDADGDGVGDSFRVVYADQRDRYPLIKAAEVTVPELSAWMVLLALSIATVAAVALRNKLISSRKANRRNEK